MSPPKWISHWFSKESAFHLWSNADCSPAQLSTAKYLPRHRLMAGTVVWADGGGHDLGTQLQLQDTRVRIGASPIGTDAQCSCTPQWAEQASGCRERVVLHYAIGACWIAGQHCPPRLLQIQSRLCTWSLWGETPLGHHGALVPLDLGPSCCFQTGTWRGNHPFPFSGPTWAHI